jgi:hypothetical protein
MLYGKAPKEYEEKGKSCCMVLKTSKRQQKDVKYIKPTYSLKVLFLMYFS